MEFKTNKEKIKYLLSKKETRIPLCEKRLDLFAMHYFREFMTHKTKDFHKQWYIDALQDKNILNVGFRDSGKTAIFGLVYIIWCICYQKYYFIVFYAFEKDKAKSKTLNIVNLLKANKFIKEDFGYLFKDNKVDTTRKDNDSMQEQKTIDEFITTNGIKVKAMSMNMSPRGEQFVNKKGQVIRPELCQPKGNIIITSKGEKDISNITKGDMVLTHKGRYRKVLDNWETGELEIYRIKIHGYSEDFSFSKGHKIYSKNYKGGFQRRQERLEFPEFNEIEKLKKGAYIGFPINYTEKQYIWNINKPIIDKIIRGESGKIVGGAIYKDFNKEIILKKEDYYILGQFVGDGTLSQYGITIYCDKNKPQVIERIISNSNFNITRNDIKNVARLKLGSVELMRICEQIKIKNKNSWKLMPYEFENDLIENQAEFIKGYIDSDGFVDYKNNCIRITSVNLSGLRQLQRILLRLNITSYIRNGIDGNENYEIQGVKCKTQKKYDLYMRNGVEILGYGLKSQTRYKYENLPVHIKDGYLWSSIKEIKQEGKEKCYSFNVKEDHSYCNHLIGNHNCLMDDIDVIKSVRNIEVIDNNYHFITGEVMGGISNNGKIVFLGNIIGEDGVIPRLLRDQIANPGWIVSDTPLINENEEIVWPEKFVWTDEERDIVNSQILDKRKHVVSLQSKLHDQGLNAFNSNYRNKPYQIIGDPVFVPENVQKLKDLSPISGFNITVNGVTTRLQIYNNCYQKEPLIVGIDMGGGIGKDYTEMTFKNANRDLVATWSCNTLKPGFISDVLTEINDRIGMDFYRNAIVPENNNHGHVFIDRLRTDNPYLYRLLFRKNTDGSAKFKSTVTLGWTTSGPSKEILIGDLGIDVDNGVCEVTKEIKSQMRTYIIDEDGKYNAQYGAYDDKIISYALADQGCRYFKN